MAPMKLAAAKKAEQEHEDLESEARREGRQLPEHSQHISSMKGAEPTVFHKNQEVFARKQKDGIYVDDPEIISQFKDINVQRLEERLLKNGNLEYFKMNGELKLDNDLLMDE